MSDMTTNWNPASHPRAGQEGVPGNGGAFTNKRPTGDEVTLGGQPNAAAEHTLGIATGLHGSRIQQRITQGLRPNTATWRPSDDLSGVRFVTSGHRDEIALKGELVFAPQRAGGTWAISRQTVVDVVDGGKSSDPNMGPFGGQMFDALVSKGALVRVEDERLGDVGAAWAAGRRTVGDTSTDDVMQAKTGTLYEIDPAVMLTIYPELTVNGDMWHDYAVANDISSWR